jgi:hypothetical protein
MRMAVKTTEVEQFMVTTVNLGKFYKIKLLEVARKAAFNVTNILFKFHLQVKF